MVNLDMTEQRNILIFGKNGQVGYELCRSLSYLGKVVAVDVDECDLTDRNAILKSLTRYKPDIIANAAAYTAVDKAEEEPELAEKLNALAPKTMAEWAADNKALMVHYSTDYVFDGTKKTPYTEEDKPNPLNVYGKTKLQGDQYIQASDCDHLIFRTSWVYGTRGKNFYLTMRRLLLEKEAIPVVNDQYGTPTWCGTIAHVTSLVLAQLSLAITLGVDTRKISGIYNLTNSGKTTWYNFADAIYRSLHNEKPTTRLARIVPISTKEYPTPAPRPAYSVLSGQKLYRAQQIKAPEWNEQLKRCINGKLDF